MIVPTQITEKAKEHQVPLHIIFITSRLHLILSEAWWKMLRYTRVDPKITSLIKAVHDNVTCEVVINGQLTKWFSVEICVRQGCLLLPILSSLSLEFVMTYMKSLCKEFKLDTNLSFDIGYADDTSITSNVLEKLQISTKRTETRYENQLLQMKDHHFIGERCQSTQ